MMRSDAKATHRNLTFGRSHQHLFCGWVQFVGSSTGYGPNSWLLVSHQEMGVLRVPQDLWLLNAEHTRFGMMGVPPLMDAQMPKVFVAMVRPEDWYRFSNEGPLG